jgi:hypothetical protein
MRPAPAGRSGRPSRHPGAPQARRAASRSRCWTRPGCPRVAPSSRRRGGWPLQRPRPGDATRGGDRRAL